MRSKYLQNAKGSCNIQYAIAQQVKGKTYLSDLQHVRPDYPSVSNNIETRQRAKAQS